MNKPDLFEPADKTANPPSDPVNKADDNLLALVGDGKQYKTTEDLAYAHGKANKFIEQLEDENRGIRQELEVINQRAQEQTTMQELIARMEEATGDRGEANATPLSSDDIVKLVTSHVDNLNESSHRKANRTASNTLLLQHYGDNADKARAHLEQKASELHVSMDTIARLSEQSPRAFAELMGVTKKDQPESTANLPATERLPESTTDTGTPVRNKAYYTALRKELGIRYWDTKIQQQLMKDAMRLGEDFYT
ncbi:hypothetical protein LCGC14_1842120 [marine sediment metagenome]|uniref:Uncharacterized protein n=1 Tax=marine sediment metagenome TaxID=412755 RepID=A0A0F9GCV9_9ZZZZ